MRAFFIGIIGFIVLIFVIVGYFLFVGPDAIQISERTLNDLWQSGDIAPIIGLPVALLITLAALMPIMQLVAPRKIRNAVTGSARVLAIHDTGSTINDNPVLGLRLEVTTPEGQGLELETRMIVSRLKLDRVKPGMMVSIEYDRLRPRHNRITSVLEDDAPPAPTQQDAATRMAQLQVLYDRHLISADEYAHKRAEILASL